MTAAVRWGSVCVLWGKRRKFVGQSIGSNNTKLTIIHLEKVFYLLA